jgi:hypothetical protein
VPVDACGGRDRPDGLHDAGDAAVVLPHEIDVDHRRNGKVGVCAVAAEPWPEQLRERGAIDRLRARDLGTAAKDRQDTPGIAVAADRVAVDDLDGQPPRKLALEQARGACGPQPQREREHREEQHDPHHPRHRADAPRLVEDAVFGGVHASIRGGGG